MYVFTPNTLIESAKVNANNAEILALTHTLPKMLLANDQLIQRGWGFMVSTVATPTATVTLPVAFDDVNYDITANMIGYKAGSDPTSRTDYQGVTAKEYLNNAQVINASSFRLSFHSSDESIFVSGTRYLFSWQAIGTKVR